MLGFVAYAQLKTLESSGCLIGDVPTLKCFEVIFQNLLIISSTLIVLILFAMFVTGSFMYLMSNGDPEKLKKARGTIKYAVIGLILFMSSYLILNIIDFLFLGGAGKIFNFTIPQY